MACRLFICARFTVNWTIFQTFHSTESYWKMPSAKFSLFCLSPYVFSVCNFPNATPHDDVLEGNFSATPVKYERDIQKEIGLLTPTIGSLSLRWLCIAFLGSPNTKLHASVDFAWWRHFPRYWPFVRGIHRSPVYWFFVRGIHRSAVNSPKRPGTRSFDVFFHLCLNKRLSKQSRHWWFEAPYRSLRRHCNG